MTTTSGKRKRDGEEETKELEIDISLPEPPSKKALRKSKKQKFSTAENNTQDLDGAGVPLGKDATHDSPPKKPEATTNSKPSTTYGIWIGNLPFNVNKSMLRSFFISAPASEVQGTPPIADENITRVHLPAPTNTAASSKSSLKPQNRGFAYVDFSSAEAQAAALTLSEATLGGRRVLIKSAKDFVGRPTKSESAESAGTNGASKGERGASAKSGRTPTQRVFVGNLGFDVTKADLEEHFAPCGAVEHVFTATFEDSGKCKGFAWVRFETVDAASAAVRGWAHVDAKAVDGKASDEDEAENKDDPEGEENHNNANNKKSKKRKWFVNRLQGRTLRCEFAEDATTRYKKRFGKEKDGEVAMRDKGGKSARAPTTTEDLAQGEARPSNGDRQGKSKYGISPGAPTDAGKRRGRSGKQSQAQDTIKYRTGGISESTGTKVTFD